MTHIRATSGQSVKHIEYSYTTKILLFIAQHTTLNVNYTAALSTM